MAARGQNHEKGKNKQAYAPKPKTPPPPKREDPTKDSICHDCGETRHWKRNYPHYLAELLKKKKNSASGVGGSGIFVIELNTILNRSWIYDTGCGTHICNTTQGLRASRKLKPRARSLYVGNGQREAVEAIGVFYLCLPNGLEIVLKNCHYAPSITRGVIFVFRFKKRIEKLQHDGLLDSTDFRAFEKYISCMSGKMARKPYTHQVERDKDLLVLIHTDVCGPFKIMSRQGASYFVTFTDDFSRYGYAYLLKHKYEVFETFKVFQKKVENQLGKTIKSLRSNRKGEYMSQEFLDHLRDHGIIAHRTPPYTLQHNGVSKRRNKTILDMVRSMMSQTTLLKFFWDYTLETAARILNMVPTKKGCEALVKRDTLTKPDKLEPRSIKCIFIGYLKETIGYYFYYPPENKVLVARNAEFLENSLITQEASGSLEDLEIILEKIPSGSLRKRPTWMEFYTPIKLVLWKKVYIQTPGIDYEETFSPVADLRAIRILIAIAAYYDYEIWQMDVKTAFLNGYLNEQVYMEQPKGFVNSKYPKPASGSNITFLILYVNGILIMGNNIPLLQSVKSNLGRCFAIKDLGEAAYILGIKIYRDRSRRLIGLCQSAYIEKILKRYCMENSKRGSIPMQEKLKLSKSQGASTPAELKRMQNVPYASTVGSIMYVVRCTRSDVAFAQNVTSRFQQNPGDLHWITVKNIQKYLRNTKDMFLVYEGDLKRELRVSCYTDAGYLTNADDHKSQTGYVFVLNGGVVDWKSAKQSIFFYFICRRAIAIANKPGITKGARHFRAKVHYLREVIEYGDVKLEKFHTNDNLADPFTKALEFPKHSEHTRNIGMLSASSLM
nr:retrotransposon protein, putative, Ty1-copia subclass [Tanacetum cinerariifolium]